MRLILTVFFAFIFIQAEAQTASTNQYSPELSKEAAPKDWFNFQPYPELWRYIRAHSKQYEMTRGVEQNRIKRLNVFCTKELSPSVQGFSIETNKDKRECYVFVESQIQRIPYGEFLEKMGEVEDDNTRIEKITLDELERDLKIKSTEKNIQVVQTAEEIEKAIVREQLLKNIRAFVAANNNPAVDSKTDFEIQKEKMEKMFESYQKGRSIETNAPASK